MSARGAVRGNGYDRFVFGNTINADIQKTSDGYTKEKKEYRIYYSDYIHKKYAPLIFIPALK